MYIDIHAHLDPYFYSEKDIDDIVKRAEVKDVKIIVANGLNKETNRHALELAKKYGIVKAALGIYPYEGMLDDMDAGHYKQEAVLFDIDKEIDFIRSHKDNIVAIGEVGLDLKTHRKTRKQFEIFDKIIKLAKEIDKPIIVHSRKAEEEIIDILEKEGVKKVVMHCFSGEKKLWPRILKNKWYCSIPTNCVRSEHFQKLIEFMPLTQLFCETDSPFLSPIKDKKNEPSFVIASYEVISRVKGIELKEVENAVQQNWMRLFM